MNFLRTIQGLALILCLAFLAGCSQADAGTPGKETVNTGTEESGGAYQEETAPGPSEEESKEPEESSGPNDEPTAPEESEPRPSEAESEGLEKSTGEDDTEPKPVAPDDTDAEKSAGGEETGPAPDALEQEAEVLAGAPAAVPELLEPAAPGTLENRGSKAVIDYSNTADGYVMAQYTAETANRLKVQVKGPATTYTYNLPQGEWAVFPLSDGNGSYQITVFENVSGTKYATVLSVTCAVTLADEFAPFLRPNQYVNYTASSSAVAKAAELTAGLTDPLQKVTAVYDYVVQTLTYDKEKAASVKSGYLPVLDEVLKEKKGICFDYAALMTGMLRSQSVPCKLVVGYAGEAYHAWISVWTEESGWIDGVIFFDGHTWQRMDPTFASSANQSASIMEYIGNGSNYAAKYLY